MSTLLAMLVGIAIYGLLLYGYSRFMRGARGPEKYGNDDLW